MTERFPFGPSTRPEATRQPGPSTPIFPSRKPIGKQADQTDGASGGCHQGRPGRNPAPRTSARSNGTTSFSTASTSSIVPWSAKERVLMLYFNVRREKAPILSGCESRPATVAPVGSNRSGW